MFKLHRHKSHKSGERIDFKFSHFEAVQVPKGWDKLFVSVTSVETGKTVAKSNKTVVRNGTCRWAETFSESIWVAQDDASKEFEECLFKFVLAMGSARSGILGETTINLTKYIKRKDAVNVSLPLKKCSYETMLQFKIQCVTPKSRDEKQLKETNFSVEDLTTGYDDIDKKSDGSDVLSRSIGSSSSNQFGSNYYPGDFGSQDMSHSASGSHRSSDSGEVSIGRTLSSPVNNFPADLYNPYGRQDSAGSQSNTTFSMGANDDPLRFNPPSFNSKTVLPNQWQEVTRYSPSRAHTTLAQRTPNSSSKDLLEAAEDTIEELRSEAKMWERNARKLKLDLDTVNREYSEQSKHQKDLNLELSAAYSERDGLKVEIDQLQQLLEELRASDILKRTENVANLQQQLEDELKFHKQCNSDLSLQLKKTQESNIELVAILQELEETIERQRQEIEHLSSRKMKMLELQESEKKLQVYVESLEKSLEEKNQEIKLTLLESDAEWKNKLLAKEVEVTKLHEKLSDKCAESDVDLMKEINFLTAKVQELEMDCNELTEENLALIFKMKESQKTSTAMETSLISEYQYSELKAKVYELEQKLQEKQMIDKEFIELQTKCSDLEIQLHNFKEKAYDLSEEIHKRLHAEPNVEELNVLEWQLNHFKDGEVNKKSQQSIASTSTEDNELCRPMEQMNGFSNPSSVHQMSCENSECQVNIEHEKSTHLEHQMSYENSECRENIEHEKSTDLENTDISVQQSNSMKSKNQSENIDFCWELAGKASELQKLLASLSFKEEENTELRNSMAELEMKLSKLQNQNGELEEKLETAQREIDITSKCLDDIKQEMMMLTSSMDSQISNSKLIERRSKELEASKAELESQLSELEEENIQLCERISGMEAQLRYLTDEKEVSRLEIEDSRCKIMALQNEIVRLVSEIERQKAEMKQRLQESHKKFSEAQEESEHSKRGNLKLQTTIENIMEECSSLQRVNEELRRQRVELQEKCTNLEAKLRESQQRLATSCKDFEILDGKLSSMDKEMKSKETYLSSEIEALLLEQKDYDRKLTEAQNLLHGVYFEKLAEAETLQREVTHLSAQISSTLDEREKIASDAVLEVSGLRADKAKLEASFQEVLSEVRVYESELNNLRLESKSTIQELNNNLNSFKEREELLTHDYENMKKLLEALKCSEENCKLVSGDLEVKLKTSEYKRQQLMEDVSYLRDELQKISSLQEEILSLKNSLDEIKFEKGKVEESLRLQSDDYEELKQEKLSLLEKINSMQKGLAEGEEAKRCRVTLEEKLLRLECDLNAREALCAQDADLKNELGRVKRANSQFQRKIQQLEEEKDECMRRFKTFEGELQLKNGLKNWKEKDTNSRNGHVLEFSDPGKLKPFQVDQESFDKKDTSLVERTDHLDKVQMLETKLAEAMEANNLYKMQLRSFLSEKQNAGGDALGKCLRGEDIRKNGAENKDLSVEEELRDLRERYFHMSLRFAEVEAQREDLVMKVKSLKGGKRWFTRT
ncbi:hypothetical protein H6P81_017555 [Aristolochia fimbriata]|uniref:C2 NT-type domain-containing protein n=1 Tax=Aristolochia fimbriata TaxID=158543 RepID=A0AAV7E1C9_ARIFI|nr:hypothetical protein H6P81_017555 [Aristolochia fimbriata]